MHPDWKRICDAFLTATSYSPEEMEEGWKDRSYDRENRPATYLTYPDAPVRVELGEPSLPPTPDLWAVLRGRRSKRNFLPEPVTLDELNCMLWGSQGIVQDMGNYQLRTAPSAGALYPIETYLVVNNVEGLQPGLYHLDVRGWALEGLRMGDLSDEACRALLDQEAVRASGLTFLWTAVMERCEAKYYERAYRYVWWDVGHISENISLVATALGLGACCMGAWHDSLVHELIGIDGKEHFSALTTAVGRIEGNDWLEDRRAPPKPSPDGG
ncbi:MAG: SagB/ThcOx family dehydrogenase [Deltaproteobacteria bacterium]|nr:SagB/ThcOx family dehydrogenase [Deltaproteobacteria bacterium]